MPLAAILGLALTALEEAPQLATAASEAYSGFQKLIVDLERTNQLTSAEAQALNEQIATAESSDAWLRPDAPAD